MFFYSTNIIWTNSVSLVIRRAESMLCETSNLMQQSYLCNKLSPKVTNIFALVCKPQKILREKELSIPSTGQRLGGQSQAEMAFIHKFSCLEHFICSDESVTLDHRCIQGRVKTIFGIWLSWNKTKNNSTKENQYKRYSYEVEILLFIQHWLHVKSCIL